MERIGVSFLSVHESMTDFISVAQANRTDFVFGQSQLERSSKLMQVCSS